MDVEQARQVLGMPDGTFSRAELRAARNEALKAHHPDKAGSDPTAVRRATYWTGQINAAFAELEELAADVLPPAAEDTAGSPAGQSFADAARRARERADRASGARPTGQRTGTPPKAQPQPPPASPKPPTQSASPRRRPTAPDRAAAQEKADAEAGRRAAGSDPRSATMDHGIPGDPATSAADTPPSPARQFPWFPIALVVSGLVVFAVGLLVPSPLTGLYLLCGPGAALCGAFMALLS